MFTEYNELLLKLLFKLVGPTKQLERFLCIRQRDLSFASLVVDKIRTSQSLLRITILSSNLAMCSLRAFCIVPRIICWVYACIPRWFPEVRLLQRRGRYRRAPLGRLAKRWAS